MDTLMRHFKQGDWIFHEGDEGECAYIVEQGSVAIVLERADGHITLATYGEGTLFGEMAIIDQKPRSAGAIALKDCALRAITRSQLNHRLERADPILKICIQVILKHLRKTLSQIHSPEPTKISNVALHQGANHHASSAHVGHHVLDSKDQHLTQVVNPIVDVEQPSDQDVQSMAETLGTALSEANPLMATDVFSEAIKTLHLEQELQIALTEKQLRLYYQPIVRLSDGLIVGFEALMRWIHPEKGMISPAVFIPIAERSGQIVEMTYWALREASSQLKFFQNVQKGYWGTQYAPLFMSVNFSGRDFLDGRFLDEIQHALQSQDLPPKSLKLEITESMLMLSPEEVQRVLGICQSYGASVAIDDFGTGYSSLSYLQSMPADTLKIDQSFVRTLHKNDRHLALVESILHLAGRLGMLTVAEGVETAEDVETLRNLGCDLAQGYYYARPMPTEQVLAWMEKQTEKFPKI
jgi:EAL domain-containing protein (putative c-di-GMP-specific phosphodiesterase class I)